MTARTATPTSPRPADPGLGELLAEHGLAGVDEEPLEHDGWSGARLTRLTRSDGRRFVLKRDSLSLDWIARVTGDHLLRETQLARAMPVMPTPVRLPHLGVAEDGDTTAVLMPDLTGRLLPWERPVDASTLERVLAALAALHAGGWHRGLGPGFPWTDRATRLGLLTWWSAARYEAAGLWVGERFRHGWEAFERHAPAGARYLVDRLTGNPGPLLLALDRLPSVGLHGDLKLGNVGLDPDGTAWLIDWQMTLVAPIAVELGWFLVANVAGLPEPPDAVLERYRVAASLPRDHRWAAERDLAIVVGLLLRGWRKGLDADAGLQLADGRGAAEDLAWWSREAVLAAERRL